MDRRNMTGTECQGPDHQMYADGDDYSQGFDPEDTSLYLAVDAHGYQSRHWLCEGCRDDLSATETVAEIRDTRRPIAVGDEVRFRAEFLRSTAQYTGPEAPTHVGPFARGTVLSLGSDAGLPAHVTVRFEDGWTQHIHAGNVEVIR